MASVRKQFVLDPAEDRDLLAWLERQDNQSAAIREALRARVRGESGLDARTLRRVVREELRRVRVVESGSGGEDVDAAAGARLDRMF